jgi:hypothetical protein
LLVAFLAPLVIGVAIAVFLVPSVNVRILPVWEPLEETIEIKGEPTLGAVDAKRGVVPVRIAEVIVGRSDITKTTGVRVTMNARAEGWVSLFNRTNEAIVVPRGAIFSTLSGKRFDSTEEIKLVGNGGTAQVPVIAQEPGEGGNVERNEIARVDGELAQKIGVMNEDKIQGGGKREVPVVAASDRNTVKQLVLQQLEAEARPRLWKEGAWRAGDELLAGSIKLVPLRENYLQAEGDQSPSVALYLEARAIGVGVNANEVLALAERTWQPALKAGYTMPPNSIRLSRPQIKQIDPSNGSAVITVKASGAMMARVNRPKLEGDLRGKTALETVRYFRDNMPLAETPLVTFDPSWAERAWRVSVVIMDPVIGAGE